MRRQRFPYEKTIALEKDNKTKEKRQQIKRGKRTKPREMALSAYT